LKLSEKILLGIVALSFMTRPFLDDYFFLNLSLLLLIAVYSIGGYWLFNSKEKRQYFLPIVTGIILSSSIYTWFRTIHLRFHELPWQILPAVNSVLFLALGIYLIAKRKSPDLPSNIKGIMFRSLIIGLITCFFSYTPYTIKAYRAIIVALNNGNEELVNNIHMVDYAELFDKAYAKGDCDEAIVYAEKSNHCGLIWLGKISDKPEKANEASDTSAIITFNDLTDTVNLSPEEMRLLKNKLPKPSMDTGGLWQISKTYDNLYDAYKCKADNEYHQGNYETALRYFLRSDSLTHAYYQNKLTRATLLNDIAWCYKGMKKYELADSLYSQAMYARLALKDTFSRGMATIISNLAESYSEQKLYSTSNSFFRLANIMYRKDSLNKNSKADLLDNYGSMIKNFTVLDSIEQAYFYVQKSFTLEKPGTEEYCNTSLYYGICLYKLNQYEKADSILQGCLQCFQSKYKPNDPLIMLTLLWQNMIM
jgi:tetratricopeptide (TPR) repeat protein